MSESVESESDEGEDGVRESEGTVGQEGDCDKYLDEEVGWD